jgi:hypothetical protein
MRKHLLYMTAVLLLCSCSHNAFEEMLFRTTDDPFYDTPHADSLRLEHTVYLSWREDEGCDTFRLMRSYDSPTLSFTCIYEGTETSYTDTDLTDGFKYIYRLDKTRGKEYFKGTTHAYGYSSDCRKDMWEPNDGEENATRLDYDLICNLPCVRYLTDGKEEMDCDWFYIEIPPCRTVEILVSQHNLSNTTEGAKTNLRVQIPESESESVKQKVAIPISNPSYVTKKFRFKIYPEKTGLFDETNTVAIGYTVSLNKIIKY